MSENNRSPEPPRMAFRGPGGGRGGPGGGMGLTERARDFGSSSKRLIALIKPYFPTFIVVLLLTIVSTASSTFGTRVMGFATTEISRGAADMIGGGAGIDFSLVAHYLAFMIGLYVVSSAIHYFNAVTLAGVTQKLVYRLRKMVDEKLRTLPLSYSDQTPYGEILSRVTNDVDTISNTLQQTFGQMFNSLLSIIMVFIMMLTISPMLTLIGLVTLPLGLYFSRLIVKFSQPLFKGQQASLGALNGYIEEMYTGHSIIKAYSLEQGTINTFDGLNDTLHSYAWKATMASGVMMPVVRFVTNLGYVAVAVGGGLMVMGGRILLGDLQAFVVYLNQFAQPISNLASVANVLQSAVAAAERIFELLDQPEESIDPEAADLPEHFKGDVQFNHLRFGYAPDNILIKDLSATIHSGQTVAIVGPTGAGKTTLVNLLLRFYDPLGGSITVDGYNTMAIPRGQLRSHFGMVLQDTWLFKGTIMENIRYGRLNATDEEVIKSARDAYCDSFIRTLPGGYDFELTEDAANISQGQRQLITIARALLADADILLLDEATSSVDTRTELLIQQAMAALMQGRTNFVIAHRLSTIRDADMILVIRDGDIIETGTHEGLLKQKGFYTELYNSQFAGKAI